MTTVKLAAAPLALALGIFLSSCGTEEESPVLAEVGDSLIRAQQLLRYEERLAENLKSKEAGLEGRRQHLQALIDKEVLIREAAAQGWDQEPEMRRKLKRAWTKKLINVFLSREIDAKISLEEREIYDHYLKTERNRAIIGGKIEVKSKDEAEEIVRLLQNGTDFEELARQRSIHRPTAERGGRFTGSPATKDQMPEPIMQVKVFPLKKGEISEPVPLSNGTYGVFKVMDEEHVPLNKVRNLVRIELHRQKASALSVELGQQLKQSLNLRLREDNMDFLTERLEDGGHAFSEVERNTALYEFDGGAITVGDLIDSARDNYRNFSGDVRAQIYWFAESILIPQALIVQAARNAGIDREQELVAWRLAREEERLLVVIRKKVTSEVRADEVEARRYYDQNLQRFVPQENLTLDEILVTTREEAIELRERVERGEDLRILALEHTLRRRTIPDSGRFHLHQYQRETHQELFEAAEGAAPGDLLGPIAVNVSGHQVATHGDGALAGRFYSVFRIIESTLGDGPKPFAKVATRARAIVLRQKRDAAFFQFLGEVRNRYQPQVKIHEETLRALVLEDE